MKAQKSPINQADRKIVLPKLKSAYFKQESGEDNRGIKRSMSAVEVPTILSAASSEAAALSKITQFQNSAMLCS